MEAVWKGEGWGGNATWLRRGARRSAAGAAEPRETTLHATAAGPPRSLTPSAVIPTSS